MKSVGVVGAGAAGMMVVATLLEGGYTGEIVLYEKNSKIGTKVMISGGGRCNVTTGTYKRKQLLLNYPRGAKFLDQAFRNFSPRQVRTWFEDHGVALKQEDDGRIFPVSDHGGDVVGVFKRLINKYDHATIATKTAVQQIKKQDGVYEVMTNQGVFTHNILVVTTGGQAYAHTGSTGDGYAFARAVGHTITPLGPSLNSFVTSQQRHLDLKGTVFPDALISHQGQTAKGPVLLTHFGLSGPGMFVVASQIPFVQIDHAHPYEVSVVPIATMRHESRIQRLRTKRTLDPKQSLRIGLTQYFTKRTSEALCHQYGWTDLVLGQLSKLQTKQIAKTLGEGISFDLIQRKPGDEFVTAGGVVTDEVDPQTMESRLSAGLYFAGEVLDVDGVTGGYNLQASRATGRAAGQAILSSEL